jgi:hypothetical protein
MVSSFFQEKEITMNKGWISFWRLEESGSSSAMPHKAVIKGFSEPVAYVVRTEGHTARDSQSADSLRDRADFSKMFSFLTIPANQVVEMVLNIAERPSSSSPGHPATHRRAAI